MGSKKINQSDLRRLMKERSEGLTKKKEEKVESPLAKYDNSGKLSCIVCNVEITAKLPWRQHILTKSHKINVNAKLKRKLQDAETVPKEVMPAATKTPVSNGTSVSNSNSKRLKSDAPTNLIGDYASSSEDEDPEPKVMPPTPTTSSVLPSDFFDSPSSSDVQQSKSIASESLPVSENKSAPARDATLPEGFFDDPILDAKARNVEYKDPKEEEWERFQKSIADETTVSESIIAEDAEKSEVNKSIDQIDEQIHNWQKVDKLLSQREDIVKQLHSKMVLEDKDNNSADEDEDLECDLDWRSKDLWKKQ